MSDLLKYAKIDYKNSQFCVEKLKSKTLFSPETVLMCQIETSVWIPTHDRLLKITSIFCKEIQIGKPFV